MKPFRLAKAYILLVILMGKRQGETHALKDQDLADDSVIDYPTTIRTLQYLPALYWYNSSLLRAIEPELP